MGPVRFGDAPPPVFVLPDASKSVVSLERIAAGGDEIDHGVEILARQSGIGRGRRHLGVKFAGNEWSAAGAAQHVLCQYVERADAQRGSVLRVLGNCVERG